MMLSTSAFFWVRADHSNGQTRVFPKDGPPAATCGKFTVRRSDGHYLHKNRYLEVFQTAEKVGYARRYDDAEPRVAENSLQAYQCKPLILLCLCVYRETYPKTLDFGQYLCP